MTYYEKCSFFSLGPLQFGSKKADNVGECGEGTYLHDGICHPFSNAPSSSISGPTPSTGSGSSLTPSNGSGSSLSPPTASGNTFRNSLGDEVQLLSCKSCDVNDLACSNKYQYAAKSTGYAFSCQEIVDNGLTIVIDKNAFCLDHGGESAEKRTYCATLPPS